MQTVYLLAALGLFWDPRTATPIEALRRSLSAIYDWYPLPTGALLLVMGFTVTAVVTVAYALARMAWPHPHDATPRATRGPRAQPPRRSRQITGRLLRGG